MSQRLLSLTGNFHIKDERGNRRFLMRNKHFALGHKAILEDAHGHQLAIIKQRMLTLNDVFDIYRSGRRWATARKHSFTFLRSRFTVSVGRDRDLRVTGDFLGWEYVFQRFHATVATVSKKWFTLGESYGVEVADSEDDVLILAIVMAIHFVGKRDHTIEAAG